MFNKNNLFVAALVVLFFAGLNASAQQTVFDLEGNVRKEVAVPDAVIAVLKSDARVDGCFREKGEGANETA